MISNYDGMSRLTRLKHQSQTATLTDNNFSYNGANQINQIAELTQTKNFSYDNIDRLTAMNNGTANENYAFDGVGNRTSSNRSTIYNYQPFNRVTATQTANYNNDANGNMVSKGDGSNFWHYVWDYENRLVTASTRKQTVRYRYDALGRRVQRYFVRGGGENTKFIYDGLDVLMDDNSGVLTKYQNGLGIDNKLKMVTNGTAKYFLQDHLGSTVSLADSSGAVVSSASYDSFGNSTNNLTTRYQYTGREKDEFTGLYFYRARWYDANLGRFISEDPIGFAGGDVNLFGYVGNRPLRFVDPFGLDDADRIYEETNFPGGYVKWYRDNGIDEIWRKEVKDHNSRPENFDCGPGYMDVRSLFIPQHPFGYNFKETGCFNHDVCYGTCGKKKADCDDAIYSDLVKEFLSSGNFFSQSVCLKLASRYYNAVDIFGDSAYDAAQKDSNCCGDK